MIVRNIHRILCQCKLCKGKRENRHILQVEEDRDGDLLVKIKGAFFFGDELILKEKDIEGCLKKIKNIRNIRKGSRKKWAFGIF